MTNELRTNDEPQRILLEASERIKACYPSGTKIEVLFGSERVIGTIRYVGLRTRGGQEMFVVISEGWEHAFSPAVHPHRVLP